MGDLSSQITLHSIAQAMRHSNRTIAHTWRCCRRCNGPLRRVQAGDDVRYEHVLSEVTAHPVVPR